MVKSNALGQIPFPTKLAFEPVQLCNAKCYCCPYSWLREDKEYRGKKMSREQICKLLDDFGGIRKRHNYNGILSISPYRFSDPLVCEDLELIFEKSEEYDLDVVITTNGIGLSGKNLSILDRYRHLITKINISLIGSNADEVKNMMGISFNKVFNNLEIISEKWPALRSITRVSMRYVEKSESEQKQLEELKNKINAMGFSVKNIKSDWVTNRIDVQEFLGRNADLERVQPKKQTAEHFVSGCGWVDNLLTRMEVMVNGDVVLCCDDAESHKTFGNIFEQSIEEIWTSTLRDEHQLLINDKFSDEKNGLICSTCSRAIWNKKNDPWIERLRLRNAQLEQTIRVLTLENRESKIK